MEVFQADNYYIFAKREKTLWWNRQTSEFTIKAGWDLSSVDDIECIGITQGIVGLISLPNIYEPHLIIIKEAVPVGVLYPPHLVYKIKSICILSAEEPDAVLTTCTRHANKNNDSTINQNATHNTDNGKRNNAHNFAAASTAARSRLFEGTQLMNKTWGAVKSAGTTIKNTTQQAAALASNQVKSTVGIRDPTRMEKRITEELHKIFDDTDSFYFCYDFDITNNLQRHLPSEAQATDTQMPDDRFFWNMHMIKDLIQLNDKIWILPIIQGFAQVEPCVIGNECFTLALVSRRSRYRAGTRYKRRGVDEQGNCANYVETEQILSFRHHQLSFTQVRGSVPIYWSQPGYKYRPPPQLNRSEIENQEAFELHFTKELSLYNGVCIVNLVEQSGKEKIIGDAYAKHILKYNNDQVVYVTFDFHDYCRGMHFENVSALVEALAPEAGAMGFHWRDQRGVICNQKSVFRVNCMDCLDRTNVVQTALGKAVLESQLVKLGLAPPYTPIPEQLKSPFMILWANNGDIISRQYAGTNALKGDYTRTGERKISGMMKDGMNSANRFLIQNFTDTFRQCIIDLMQGQLNKSEQLKEDEMLRTILQILCPPGRAPIRGYYYGGVLQPELQFLDNILFARWWSVTNHYKSRCECCRHSNNTNNNSNNTSNNNSNNNPLFVYQCRDCKNSCQHLSNSAFIDLSHNHTICQEKTSLQNYYLARFKDSYRQATIDMMLGNQVSAESLNAFGGQPAIDDTDAIESAEHAKLIVEDCRRLLLGSSQYPVGAWGLIDADPNSGDINETEVDTVLLLTDECYIVAEYDSHLDKIVRFEKVLLENITLIELGMYQQSKMFPTPSSSALCLRINYKVDNADGYFHMFRSANVRFFNNVAYIIKTVEEIAESFHSILEMFRIALDTAGHTDVKFITEGVLPRRKSKNPLLEVPKGMPRNLSESQLVQISSKAFSNVAGQFSKFGQSLNPKKNRPRNVSKSAENRRKKNVDSAVEAKEKAVFLIGGDGKSLNSASGSDSEENDSSIYEPESVESDNELVITAAEKHANFNSEYNFLPSVGIVMGNAGGNAADSGKMGSTSSPPNLQHELIDKDRGIKPCEDVASISISSVATHITLPTGLLENAAPVRSISPNPQICIQDDSGNSSKVHTPTLNTSSNEQSRSPSPNDIKMSNVSIDTSKLRQLKSMKSPLTKIAKGVQNIGINLDPRKIVTKTTVLSPVTITAGLGDGAGAGAGAERSIGGNKEQLEEMWSELNCKTKLIAL